ncbi:cytosol aminopeptidase-like [Pectinophora gossypiella]|uniref:cytosol aminopeptidase-like n=1 Tax=Pectinophora gossypiella TaxID=13191 RepID=UPI00214E6A32|nr:cytosol aminopeptidase-like [Pectinophora gossypiella]
MGFSKLLSSVKWTRHKIVFISRIGTRACSKVCAKDSGEKGAGGDAGAAAAAGADAASGQVRGRGGGGGGRGRGQRAGAAGAAAGGADAASGQVRGRGGGGGGRGARLLTRGSVQGVVLGVYETKAGFELTPAAREYDQRGGGKISRALNEAAGRLRAGGALLVTEPAPGCSAAALAGLGARGPRFDTLEQLDVARERVRAAAGAGVAALAARGAAAVAVDGCGAPDAAAEGAALAAWRFQEFKSCASREPETRVSLLEGGAEGGEGGQGAALWHEGTVRARAQNWARFLSDMPANKMTPVDLAQAALDALCPLGVRADAHDRAWMQTQNMQAILTVARGSCEEPVFLEATYDGPGAGNTPPVLLVAKGVTFDSGGMCLKRPAGMEENRGSMAGAAVAIAALRALAELKVGVRLRLAVPLCENMISGQCMKVGDVVRALNGLSIQIEDTDMEGRLLMADALVYGQALHKPALVVDVATLTHGVLLATGGGAFGCFSNSEELWRAVRAAGAHAGDRPWRFPLWRYYQDQLTNDVSVDLRNKGSSKATPCVGAAFLRNFVCGDWVHMDIAGVGKLSHAPAPPYLDTRRMTGRPTRTLVHFLQGLAAPPSAGAGSRSKPCGPATT